MSDLVLPIEYKDLPLKALRLTAREKIGRFLNLEGLVIVCMGDDGELIDVSTNYNGLAELAGFDFLEIRNLERHRNPTLELLDKWTNTEWKNATVGCLWKYLQQMEREDVMIDCIRVILNDCKVYKEFIQIQKEADLCNYNPVQDPTVTGTDDMRIDEFDITTRHDVRNALVGSNERQMYDAFVCYSMEDPRDRQFVRNMIEEIELLRGLKLFVPGRDDLPGAAENNITAYLIEKRDHTGQIKRTVIMRCTRVVILLSKAFLRSPVCDFQLKFAQCLAPGARSKRLIPLMLETGVVIPRILRFLAVCDFTKDDMVDWVWDRLESAIMAPVGRQISDTSIELEESLKEVLYPTQKKLLSSDSDCEHSSYRTTMSQASVSSRSSFGSGSAESFSSQYRWGSSGSTDSSVKSRTTLYERRAEYYSGEPAKDQRKDKPGTSLPTVLPSQTANARTIPYVSNNGRNNMSYPRVQYSPQGQLMMQYSPNEQFLMECSTEERSEHFV